MDFFGILFDMKNGKKVPYSKTYFDTLFAENLAGVTTLTGTLPLTFTTSETALRSWTIYGNNTPHNYSAEGTLPLTFTTHTARNADDWSISGNDKAGKNLLDIESSTIPQHMTIDSVDNSTGSIVLTAESGYTYLGTSVIITNLLEIGKTYEITLTKNNATPREQLANATLRRVDTNAIIASTGSAAFEDAGDKTFTYTHTQERAEQGIYFSLLVTGNSTTGGTLSVSNLMIREASTSADFEPYQIGVGQRTKNLLEITANTRTINGVTFTGDKQAGTITANGKADLVTYLNLPIDVPSGDYYYSGCALGGSASTYDLFAWDNTIRRRPKKWDGETNVDSDYGGTSQEIKVDSEHSMQLSIRIRIGYTCNNLVFKPMLRAADTSADFVPFGYEIPLNVNNTTQDIYIGSAPLTAGQLVSKTSTGVDIATSDGNNNITTSLSNQPDMSITYNEFTGVGEYVNGQWQIPLTVTCDRNLFNIYGNMGASGGTRVIDYNAETSSITGEMSANSFFQLGTQNAIVKGDETFAISFDKTTAGTAELRIIKGEGSGAEIIETFDISAIKSYRVVFECEESFGNVYPRLVATEAATQTFEHIMIKKASDKGGFVPYGAKYEYNVPIEAPLIEGQSVTDTLTINTFEGENVLDTTLTDPVSMTIKFKE